MNAITHALKIAGVRTPTQPERIWRVIKDNPGITSSRVAEITGVPHNNTSSLAKTMVDRGMLTMDTQQLRVKGPRGSWIVRKVAVFTVDPRMNGEYEMHPAPLKPKAAVITLAPEPKASITPAPAPTAPKTDIDHLTLGEARSLYDALHQLFGARK